MKSVILLVVIFFNTSLVMAVPERNKVRKVAEHLMESPEAQLRIAAAREMRKIDPPAYRQFLQKESKAWVREAARE